MPIQIRYSLRSRQEELDNLEYVLKMLGQDNAREIYVPVEHTLEKIAAMPDMFPASQKRKGLKKCVFSEQTSIDHRIRDAYMEVISFRANRKNPGQFKM